MKEKNVHPAPYGNPYISGVFLGLTLLASFLVLGAGLGASSGLARVAAYISLLIAPVHTLATEYFGKWGETPLHYYLVYMAIGIVIGGFFSAFINSRTRLALEKGKSAAAATRIWFAAAGGVLVGFASRLAGGCTSGQALTGGALLLTGSLIFLVCIFAGGYAAAYFFRRQWHD
jgi:uncharacterized membrane protein YedE/YeeE